MKRFFILLFFILPFVLSADEGVGILFDNSGSMRQYCSQNMLKDAQNTVLDLILEGKYDQNIWRIEANSQSYQTNIWKPGELVYVHAFGELTSRVEPFFKADPDWGELSSQNDARQFIQEKLFRKLDFRDQFTNFDLAKNLCWYKLASELGALGKSYYLNLVIVSDFLQDPQHEFAGAGDRIQNLFINNNAAETTFLRLVHNESGSGNVLLEIRLLRIGPLFISQPAPTTPSAGKPQAQTPDRIVLLQPKNPLILSEGDNQQIKFAWDTKGNFEKYIFEIQSIKPKRKVLNQVVKVKSTAIPARSLLQKMNHLKTDKLVWFVKGVYPEDHSGGTLSSNSGRFSIQRAKAGCGSGIWILIVIIAVLAAIIFLYPKLKKKLSGMFEKKEKEEKIGGSTGKARDDDEW